MMQDRPNLLAFPKFTRQCLFCHQRQKHCSSCFAIGWARLVELVKWQGWCAWISVCSLLHT